MAAFPDTKIQTSESLFSPLCGGRGTVYIYSSSVPCLCTICDPPKGADMFRSLHFSRRGKLFLAYRGWQWCHKCFLFPRSQVRVSRRDSPEFSCCSEGGGRGAEPTRGDSVSHPLLLIQWCFSGWQMLLNPAWPRELWWLGWVTGP